MSILSSQSNDFSGGWVKDGPVAPRRCKIDIGLHCQVGVRVQHIVVSAVRVSDLLDPFDVVAVAMKLDGVIVDDDKPITEQAVGNLIDKEWVNFGG